MDFHDNSTEPDEKGVIKPVIRLAKTVAPILCPNPNISVSFPNKSITFGCK